MHIRRFKSEGFTLVEILTIIVVISILLSGGWVVGDSYFAYTKGADDAERQSDVEGLARAFEQYYRDNAHHIGGTYPTTGQLSSAVPSGMADATRAPGQSDSSLSAADSTAPQTPTIYQYKYQPYTKDDLLCTTGPCVRFVFYYREEKTNNIVTIDSQRQQ